MQQPEWRLMRRFLSKATEGGAEEGAASFRTQVHGTSFRAHADVLLLNSGRHLWNNHDSSSRFPLQVAPEAPPRGTVGVCSVLFNPKQRNTHDD